MKILWLNLKAVELILNTASYTGCSKPYWEEERKVILKKILEYQLRTFER